MLEESLIQRVLGEALRTGGDFAEVFAEDKRSSSAHFDDGKVEEVGSGRDRGAGIRDVVGEEPLLIYVYRPDVVSQAVSFWRAVQTRVWRGRPDPIRGAPAPYHAGAIEHDLDATAVVIHTSGTTSTPMCRTVAARSSISPSR
mgnify:CR=1 FL=1